MLESTKEAAANYVPGASLYILVKDASGAQHIQWVDNNNDDTNNKNEQAPSLVEENLHTPDESTRLLVTNVIDETPPFVACFTFCLTLNIMMACLFLGILVVYLHYRFGFTTSTSYEAELCNYMRVWNRHLFLLFVAVCGLGLVDLIGYCIAVLANNNSAPSQSDGMDSLQQQQQDDETDQVVALPSSCWIKTRNVLKYTIDVVFLVWILQGFWKTNRNVPNMSECPNMYMFTHVYSSIMSVLAILGIVSAILLACLLKLYGKSKSSNNSVTLEMDV